MTALKSHRFALRVEPSVRPFTVNETTQQLGTILIEALHGFSASDPLSSLDAD